MRPVRFGWTADSGEAQLVGGRRIWSPFLAVFELDGGPEVHLAVEFRDGSPEVRDLRFVSVGTGRAIRPADLRAVKLDDLMFDAVSEAFMPSGPDASWRDTPLGRRELAANPHFGEDNVRPPSDDERDETRKLMENATSRPRRRKLDDDVLREVASVYRRNISDRPTLAVREHFRVKPSTASMYVKAARTRADPDTGKTFLGQAPGGERGRGGVAGEVVE